MTRADGCTCGNAEVIEHLPGCTVRPFQDPTPWNETNPEWWRAQVESRGGLAWTWLVNEWRAATGQR